MVNATKEWEGEFKEMEQYEIITDIATIFLLLCPFASFGITFKLFTHPPIITMIMMMTSFLCVVI